MNLLKSTALGLLALYCITSSITLAAEERIRVGFPHFPPFSEMVEGQCVGYYCELAQQIFTDALGIELEAVPHPWTRIQREVELGNLDVMFAIPSPKREEFAIMSEVPIYRSEMKLFTYQDHNQLSEINQIKTVADIKRLELVAITNHGNAWHASQVEAHDVKTIHAISEEHIIRMLAAKRGDIVIDLSESVYHSAENTGLADQIKETPVVIDAVRIHLAVSRASPFAERMNEINKAIGQLKQ